MVAVSMVLSHGDKPLADVVSLRRQLRELITSSVGISVIKIQDLDREIELCKDRWEDFRALHDDLGSVSIRTENTCSILLSG